MTAEGVWSFQTSGSTPPSNGRREGASARHKKAHQAADPGVALLLPTKLAVISSTSYNEVTSDQDKPEKIVVARLTDLVMEYWARSSTSSSSKPC